MDYLADVIERNYRATFKTTTLLTRVGGRIIRITTMPLFRSTQVMTTFCEGRPDPEHPGEGKNMTYYFHKTYVDESMGAGFVRHDCLVELAMTRGTVR